MTPLKLALIFILIGLLPFVAVSLAIAIASLCGTELSAAGAQPCIILGRDISGVLYAMFMSGWLVLFTGGVAVWGLLGTGLWALLR